MAGEASFFAVLTAPTAPSPPPVTAPMVPEGRGDWRSLYDTPWSTISQQTGLPVVGPQNMDAGLAIFVPATILEGGVAGSGGAGPISVIIIQAALTNVS